MAKAPLTPPLDVFRHWARTQFGKYSKCVGFIESEGPNGDLSIGTCFHVGEGVFVTARHVVEHRSSIKVGFGDLAVAMDLIQDPRRQALESPVEVRILQGPLFHQDPEVDVACLRLDYTPSEFILLGGHLEEYLGQYELLLHRTLVMGYPPVPHTNYPVLIASLGEINALVTLYSRKYIHFLVSSMARGGFSGGPVLIAYDELNERSGTALLGLVTDSLVCNGGAAETGYMAVLSVDPIYECLEVNNMLPAFQALTPEADI